MIQFLKSIIVLAFFMFLITACGGSRDSSPIASPDNSSKKDLSPEPEGESEEEVILEGGPDRDEQSGSDINPDSSSEGGDNEGEGGADNKSPSNVEEGSLDKSTSKESSNSSLDNGFQEDNQGDNSGQESDDNKNIESGHYVSIIASRDYSVSGNFQNAEVTLPQGTYKIPKSISVLAGNAGTGWVELEVGGNKFCYQGDAKNNSEESLNFSLKKMQLTPAPCHSNSPSTDLSEATASVTLLSDDSAKLSVRGGGCSGYCSFTEVEANLKRKD